MVGSEIVKKKGGGYPPPRPGGRKGNIMNVAFMNEKLCLFCEHFYLITGESGYSDVTPGWSAEMGCAKNIIEIDLMNDSTESYRQKILKAQNCEEFQPVLLTNQK